MSVFIDIINMWEKFRRNHWKSSVTKSCSKFSFEIVLEFQKNKLLWGLNEPPVWISGTSNSSVCLFLKPKPIANRAVLEKVLFSFRSTINYSKLCSEIKWLVPLHFWIRSFGWNLCILMYCNVSLTAFTTVCWFQFKIRYWFCKLP